MKNFLIGPPDKGLPVSFTIAGQLKADVQAEAASK